MEPTPDPATANRRRFLAGGAALVGALLVGCAGDDDSDEGGDGADSGDSADGGAAPDGATSTTAAPAGDGPAPLTAADFDGLGPCLLTPEQMEGPFYLAADLVRRDITEGASGHPLRLGLRVVDEACAAVPGAVVDVWHADAGGDYSAFSDDSGGDDAGEGTTFLRGSQVADDQGIVEFATVYPGWYAGRAVHIHVKAYLEGSTVLTSQLYFPEDVTDTVHAQPPYAAHGTRDTRNEDDGIAGDPQATGNMLTLAAVDGGDVGAGGDSGGGTLGLVVLGVDPATA
jgi:protocatechuate 3,4-dioxygenase beta subunit